MISLGKLFSPIRIGGMELKNRIVMAPMDSGYTNEDNTVSQKLLDYFEARAKGGAGLIYLPSISVDQATAVPRYLSLWDDKFILGIREIF